MDTDDDSDSGNIFSTYPFSWVLVPLIIFVGGGTLLMCYRYRRRRKLRMLYGTNALEQDIEAMGRRPRQRPPNERRERGNRRGLGFGLGSREEGLNELGEAPPAYTAPQKQPEDTEGVELRPIQQPPGTTTTEGASTSRPPAYDDVQRGADQSGSHPAAPTSTSNLPEPPPRAVLSSN
ncbi:uncharacterized protein GGS22DRAFT_161302 [Annulohypoxylon maeteangense]|uniref:uncharacterized protein n=1 Tax=Annulohypoxylon maeteangense TaxID=1927788 RepID=UPI002008C0D2|nr:uncharacterized protein GGS22DRAFT_161302 [Annulohypoxylon maeteangense]KAI0885592.1 hypothetical protein GGS22DRAFT_161302 [Annulohypoxylon maeteangense]